MMLRILRIMLTIALFGILFWVRAHEVDLFYDPLIVYFKNNYLQTPIPEIDNWYLIINMLFRYTINSLVTLGIIYMIFYKRQYVKFAGLFLAISFVLLIIIFYLLLKINFESGYLLPFYIRKFIVHPLFLLVLLPIFYYQDKFDT